MGLYEFITAIVGILVAGIVALSYIGATIRYKKEDK